MRSRIPNSELDLLSQVPLFANCSRKELREIANLGTPVDATRGTILTDEKEVGSEFFLLLDGEAVCKVRGRTDGGSKSRRLLRGAFSPRRGSAHRNDHDRQGLPPPCLQ